MAEQQQPPELPQPQFGTISGALGTLSPWNIESPRRAHTEYACFTAAPTAPTAPTTAAAAAISRNTTTAGGDSGAACRPQQQCLEYGSVLTGSTI